MSKYFGTDGARGKANDTLTSRMAFRIGRFLGQYPHGHVNRILVCRDTRRSGEMFLFSLESGLLASGSEVFDIGVSTTPSVSYLVRREKFNFGIMISASHNPFDDNGIKIFNGQGEKLAGWIEDLIEAYIDRPEDDLPLKTGADIGIWHDGSDLRDEYLAWLVSKAPKFKKKPRILVDCANGSASHIAPEFYKRIGADATFINNEPDGTNINLDCGATHLEGLIRQMDDKGYDFGFAFDGDSDRFMAVSKNGTLIDGDMMIFLGALYLKKKGKLHGNEVVITVMSNLGLRKALEKNGLSFDVVMVGDKNVQARLKENDWSIGGEQSGHVIFLQDLNTGDGLLTSVKLLSIWAEAPEIMKKMSDLRVYPQLLKNITFSNREALNEASRSVELSTAVLETEKALGSEGRVLVRPSGTEPLLRIMVEGPTRKACEAASKLIIRSLNGK